jgi:hypothetical protein
LDHCLQPVGPAGGSEQCTLVINGATIKNALTALWEASDRVCGKRLKVMIPTLLPALEQMADCSLATRIEIVFWPSAPLPSTACSST